MTAFRVLITGSRSWAAEQAIWDALDGFWTGAMAGGYLGLVVIHGGAKGADLMAYRWVRDREAQRGWAVTHEPHAADWSIGKAAGVARNAAMVRKGADVCLAFLDRCSTPKCVRKPAHDSHGATHCADLAERAGIHVERFRPVLPAVPVGLPSTPSPTESE